MASDITDINAMVARKIQDKGSFLASADIDALIGEAVKEYSRHRPQVIVEDEAGDGGFDYQLTGTGTNILASWEKNFSVIRKLVYPVDDASQTETVIDEDDFEIITKIVSTEARDHLRFLAATPIATEAFRAFYTARHVLDGSGSTVPAADDEAVANLAAAHCMEAIAARYLSTKDPSVAADVTDYQSRADEARRLAKAFRDAYAAQVGQEADGGQPAASVVGDTDLGFQWSRPFLFHGKRNR